MPELPEIECLARAIKPLAEGRTLRKVHFIRTDLREEVPTSRFNRLLKGQEILRISRRSKYLLFHTQTGVGIFHLGMSGNILCYDNAKPKQKHTHATLCLSKADSPDLFLHFVDPRRFGYINCCTPGELESHRYFRHLGPEPLALAKLAKYLYETSRKRKTPVKCFIMNASVIVGVGNIYASESLFSSKIHPLKKACDLSKLDYKRLSRAIKTTLMAAIKAGGTTFRDFRNPDGNPGYFAVALKVYGRENKPCKCCQSPIQQIRLTNRATYYCKNCQVI
jgi:formamidopyrimidine-DNA glycosylase